MNNFNTLLPTARGATQFGRGPDNALWTPADFDEFTIVVPDDPRLPAAIRGQTISGLYVIKDAKRPLVDDFRTFAKNYGDHKETYNGADFNVNWRMGRGGTVGGGMTWGDAHINDCYVVDDPTQLRFCDRTVDPNGGLVRGGLQVKLLGRTRFRRLAGERHVPIGARARDYRRLDEHHLQQHDPVPRQHANESWRHTEYDRSVDRAGDAV